MEPRRCRGYAIVSALAAMAVSVGGLSYGEGPDRKPPGRQDAVQRIQGVKQKTIPVLGKGVLIQTLYNRDKDTNGNDKTSANYQMRKVYKLQHANPPGLVPPHPQVDKEQGSLTLPDGTMIEFYTLDQILGYIKTCGASWVAVKSSDSKHTTVTRLNGKVTCPGCTQFDQALIDACKAKELKLLAWVRLDAANNQAEMDRQADAAQAALQMETSGILVMPSGDGNTMAYTEMMAGDKNKPDDGLAVYFIQKILEKDPNPFIAYSPDLILGGHNDQQVGKIQRIMHDKIIAKLGAYNKLNPELAVLMPRFFWGGARGDQFYHAASGKFNAVWSQAAGGPQADFSLVPLVQCERTNPRGAQALHVRQGKPSHLNDAQGEIVGTTVGGAPVYKHIGIGVYLFDGFKTQDHLEFASMSNKAHKSTTRGAE